MSEYVLTFVPFDGRLCSLSDKEADMAVRLYSIFEQDKQSGQWTRLSDLELPKAKAVRYWQNALLAPYLGVDCGIRELRPIVSKPTATGK
jgi:hypothetical protein